MIAVVLAIVPAGQLSWYDAQSSPQVSSVLESGGVSYRIMDNAFTFCNRE
jgi:hypothetical protein